MKQGTKYRLKEDRFDWPAGTIVYPLVLCHYGLASDDTRATGIEHVCVTQDPDGGYPFITAPVGILEEVLDTPAVTVAPKPFDNYEISPCTRTEEPGKPGIFYFEVCEPHEAHVWTLYGHIPGEGVMAIGDFATREGAEEAFQRITGIPFAETGVVQDRLRVMHAGPRLLEALEKAHSRLLWARDLAEKASNLVMLDTPSGAQELLDEIASSEYANDDLDAITDAIAEAASGKPSQPSKNAAIPGTRLDEVLQAKDLDEAHDALSDLLEAPDAGNDEIRDAAITMCEALISHHEKRKAALARLRSNATVDRRCFDAEDVNGQKIGMAAEYECGTIRIQIDKAPGNGLVDLVPQVAGRAA